MSEIFSVSGGKFHFPADPHADYKPWTPTQTACGLTVTPLNYFATVADADAHTGGRLESRWLCRHCAAKRKTIADRLEYLRGELRAERISYGELHELQSLAAHIQPGDVELLEPAGVPEFDADSEDGSPAQLLELLKRYVESDAGIEDDLTEEARAAIAAAQHQQA